MLCEIGAKMNKYDDTLVYVFMRWFLSSPVSFFIGAMYSSGELKLVRDAMLALAED